MYLPLNTESFSVNLHYVDKLVYTVITLLGILFGFYINHFYGKISGLILLVILVWVIYELYLGSSSWAMQQANQHNNRPTSYRTAKKYRWYENVSLPTMFTFFALCSNHLSYFVLTYIISPTNYELNLNYICSIVVGLFLSLFLSKRVLENSLNELKIIMAYGITSVVMIIYTMFLALIFGNILVVALVALTYGWYIYWILDELFVYC